MPVNNDYLFTRWFYRVNAGVSFNFVANITLFPHVWSIIVKPQIMGKKKIKKNQTGEGT